MERDRAKRINKERFESLKHDTDKLLELATELKQNVDRANENTMSLDVIRKADEIDKLAKQIREKMKGQ
jgi:nitric oxide reductase activation protein